ncbi:MAG: PEP-CTERM sorting domain-containing protein [Cephaloticoccus sp.]|nr:PEP-CTERM sorting domain-containing protein [Cephaloticoccus sp.]MCF7761041.1 PEP-CTERM sorting domain-containing protein [Cephaloticoccus sp.]
MAGLSAQITITDTTGWTAWQTAGNALMTDAVADQQTGQGQDDFAGDNAYAGFQQKAGLMSSVDTIMYRARMEKYDSKGFGGSWELGMDIDGDGRLDLVMKMSDKNGQTLSFAQPGTDLNQSPSTTSFGSFAGAITLDATTYNYQNATAADGGKVTGTPTKDDNAWVTFAISFANLQTAIRTYAISSSGANLTGYTLGYGSTISYIAFTSTQGNAINQDLFGTTGNLSSVLTWAELGAISGPLNAGGVVPEPATFLQLGMLLFAGVGIMVWRRRKDRGVVPLI